MPGRECWTDIQGIIGPPIEGVMARGESTWHEDAFVRGRARGVGGA